MIRLVLLAVLCVVVYCQPNPAPGSVRCGVQTVQPATKRIVGGKAAVPGSWPWAVLIADSIGLVVGTGSIIHPHVILTTARHFESPGYSFFNHDITYWRVFAAKHNISMVNPLEKYYHIQRVVLHPGYNMTSLENDLALVITKEPIRWNDHTRPVCLPDATHAYHVGEVCYLPGWGSTSKSGSEEIMNQVALPILQDTVCSGHFPYFITATQVCAGYENAAKDFCKADLGGPLTCKDQSGAWYIQGIAATGGDCTKANEPGVFDDVSKYSAWIKMTMESAGYSYQTSY